MNSKEKVIFKWLWHVSDFSFHTKVVKANKLCYWFFLFFSFSLLSVPGKLQSTEKGTTILHSKVFKPSSFSPGWIIFYTFTLQFLVDMCNHWHFAVQKYVRPSFFFFFFFIFCRIIKVGHTKICFFGSCNTMSSEFWGFLGSPLVFKKATGHLRDTCCRVGDEVHQSLMSFCRGEKSSNARLQTPVSSEFGVAVCVALYRNELFHAGGAPFV